MFLKNEFSNRLVQVSLFSAIVYYITAYPVVFESARKYFPIKFKKTHHLLIFHTFVFMVLMYVLTYFVFDPIVRVVEGSNSGLNDDGDPHGWAHQIRVGNVQEFEGPTAPLNGMTLVSPGGEITTRYFKTDNVHEPVCDPSCPSDKQCISVFGYPQCTPINNE